MELPSEQVLHAYLLWIWMAQSILSFLALVFVIDAPYGRHAEKASSKAWGPSLNAKLAWVLMESPALVVPLVIAYLFPAPCLAGMSNKILLGLFVFHYFNRVLIYPFRTRGGKPMPLSIMFAAFVTCSLNGYLQARELTALSCESDSTGVDARYGSLHFYLGVCVFFIGWAANYHSDSILRNLRKPGETGYQIPRGGLFEFVSGANFASEILEWIGFAIAAGTLTAFAFALLSCCNIGPRAVAHHRWYQDKFKDEYPAHRKAIIPFLL